jgi:hypothetical protein
LGQNSLGGKGNSLLVTGFDATPESLGQEGQHLGVGQIHIGQFVDQLAHVDDRRASTGSTPQ